MATSYGKNPENRGSTKESQIQVMPSSSSNEREGNSERSVENIYFERKHVCIAPPAVKGIASETVVYRKMGKSSEENLVLKGMTHRSYLHYMGSSNMYETVRNSETFAGEMFSDYRYVDSSNVDENVRNNKVSAGEISTECNYSNTNSSAVADTIPETRLHSSIAESSDESIPEIKKPAQGSQLQNMNYSSGDESESNCPSPLEEIPVEVTYSNTDPETHLHNTVPLSSDESNPENREPIQGSQFRNMDYSSVDETESGSQSPLEEIPVEVTFSDTAPEIPIHRKMAEYGKKDPVSEETRQENQVQSLDSSSLDENERNNQRAESFFPSTHSTANPEVTDKQHCTPFNEGSKEGNSEGQMQQDNGEKTVESGTLMETSSPKGLEQQKTDANDKPHKCTLCNASFSKAGNLINHIRAHNYEKPYVCEICSAAFSKSGNLVNHVKIHNGEKPFKCDLCDESFAEKEGLNTHIDTHTGEKSHKCSICDAAFAQLGSLRRHARIHTGEKPHNCTICKATFSSPGTLRTHIGTHTGEKPYKCTVCEAAFLQSSNLKRHQRIHTGEKPYKCTQCVAAFTDTEHLKAHFRTHTGEKPFKCSQCSAAYPRAGSLKAHMRTHTGERRHICNLCCASFLESSHLKSHLKTHTSEKPHKCTLCGAAFLRLESLKSHMRTHTGERPHKCEFCESAFTTSQHLKIHIRTHTGEKPYSCKVCSVAFSRTGTLRRHMRTHSSKEPKE